MAHDIRCLVGIAHANMPPEFREELALDHFLRAIEGTDVGALLTVWRQDSLQKAADTAACWEAARTPLGGAGSHAIAVQQVGPVDNGAMAAGVATMGDRASIERMVQEAVDNRLSRAGPRRLGPEGTRERPSGGTPI